ncbi:hypothetical protein NB701_003710 [Pantoea ananatis]|nr:hypothetical protein [Pantoea ananatis]
MQSEGCFYHLSLSSSGSALHQERNEISLRPLNDTDVTPIMRECAINRHQLEPVWDLLRPVSVASVTTVFSDGRRGAIAVRDIGQK